MLAALLSAWQIDSAVALLRDLPSRQFHPDTCSYNTVMGALAKQPLRGQQVVLPFMGHMHHSEKTADIALQYVRLLSVYIVRVVSSSIYSVRLCSGST